jgi:hypothetical protein
MNFLKFRFMFLYSDGKMWHNESFKRIMRIMILKRDLNVFVKPFIEYLQSFEYRRNVFAFRKNLKKMKTI